MDRTSCRTAAMDQVTWATLPRIILLPILRIMAMPIAARKRNGSAQDPHMAKRTAKRKTAATTKIKKGISIPLVLSLRTVTAASGN